MFIRSQPFIALILPLTLLLPALAGCRKEPDPPYVPPAMPSVEDTPSIPPRAESKDEELRFIEQVILRSGNALRLNSIQRAPRLEGKDDEQASLAVYLMSEFGYETGDTVSPEIISTLMKTVAFSSYCAQKDIINSSMKIVQPGKARLLFHEMFSKSEMRAFEHMDRSRLDTF